MAANGERLWHLHQTKRDEQNDMWQAIFLNVICVYTIASRNTYVNDLEFERIVPAV